MNNNWLNIYKQFIENNSKLGINYNSIIFYDIAYKSTEYLENYMIKQPISPIILTNIESIFIMNSNDLNSIIKNNNALEQLKFISNQNINLNKIKNNYFNNNIDNQTFNITINKSYDLYLYE